MPNFLNLTDVGQKQCDAISLTLTSSTVETYKFFNGGTSGNLVCTIVVTYTDSTKSTIVSAVRTP